MIDPALESWRQLACAILLRAVKDAHSRNGHRQAREADLPSGMTLAGDARAFLASDGARWLVAVIDDLDPAGLDRVLSELGPVEWGQLPLAWES